MPEVTLQQAFQAALQHHQAGQLSEAQSIYRQILAHDPRHFHSLHHLGLIANQAGQSDDAVDLIRQALAHHPDYPEAHNNLGTILNDLGQLDTAIASYRQAIALNPDYAEAHNNLGVAFFDKGQLDDAITSYRRAIRLNMNYAEAQNNLGNALRGKGLWELAVAAYRQAIIINPNYPQAYNNLGNAMKENGQLHEAIRVYRQCIALNPKIAAAHNNLGNALKDIGLLDEAISAYRQAITLHPQLSEAHSNLICTLQFHPDYDAEKIAEEHRCWNRQHGETFRPFIQVHTNERSRDRRLRIGYVSPDFRDHVIGRNLLPLLVHHDPSQVEIFAYAQVLLPDAMTAQLRAHTHHWRSIVGLSDEQVAGQIRADEIDCLIDLTLHLSGNRLGVFARRPAPVQLTFAGYPGSTGLTTIDYRLTDLYLDPPGIDESIYSEKTIRLPDTFWCYDPLEGADIPVRLPPVLQNGFITFGCLNNFCKINESVLRLWASVLRAVPTSHLLMMAAEGNHRSRTLEFLKQEGIAPQRIEFVASQPRRAYYETYHRIDIGLDTLPYNGHTTSLDSFWMGVPVITQVGKTLVGRAGLSQLTNLKLTDCIAQTPEEFIQLAAGLAHDVPRLTELRASLRSRMQDSPLMEAPRFARNIEAAYCQAWQQWCEMVP